MTAAMPAPLSYRLPNQQIWKDVPLAYPSPPLIVFEPKDFYEYRGQIDAKGRRDTLGGITLDLVGAVNVSPDRPEDRRARMTRIAVIDGPDLGGEPVFDVSLGTLVRFGTPINIRRLAVPASPLYHLYVIVVPPPHAPLPGENPAPVLKLGAQITGYYNCKPQGL